MDLFESSRDSKLEPLAYRMRPATLEEYSGQDHIVGEGRLLRRMIQADQLSSVIFYGPPGTGKTTLARVIAHTTKSVFTTMNAVLSGVKTLREEIEKAKKRYSLHQKKTILFIDEIHRWNKAQQDALLPWVENGTIILIGATTENPYFEVNSALVSRSRIFQLKTLTKEDLLKIAASTLTDPLKGYGKYRVEFEKGALEHLVDIANGDARSLLNAIELAVETTPEIFPPPAGEKIYVSLKTAEESIQKKVVLYDKEGDYHFDIISAFIKSIRGSDCDAVLYWLAKMVRAGEDPKFIFRRMLISACEDIGLADPQALVIVQAAAAAFDRVGMPEGRFHLTQAALYLATAPKSNSALGFFDALAAVEDEQSGEVPNHLKDGGRDKEGFGHGKGYLYPHAYHDHWVPQQYLPDNLKGKIFYTPSENGYEGRIKQDVLKRREANMDAAVPIFPEILTTAPGNKKRDKWLERLTSGKNKIISSIRDDIFSRAEISPHHRVLILNANGGLLLWEACRHVPEGIVYALPGDRGFGEQEYRTLQGYVSGLPEMEKPVIVNKKLEEFEPPENLLFERILGRNVLTRIKDREYYLKKIHRLLHINGTIVFAEIIPSASKRISSFLDPEVIIPEDMKLLKEAEKKVYNTPENLVTGWNENNLYQSFINSGFKEVRMEKHIFDEKRIISLEDINSWFNPDLSPFGYGGIIDDLEGTESLKRITGLVIKSLAEKEINWPSTVCTFTAGV